jgi:hypothetical protein
MQSSHLCSMGMLSDLAFCKQNLVCMGNPQSVFSSRADKSVFLLLLMTGMLSWGVGRRQFTKLKFYMDSIFLSASTKCKQ